MNLSKPILHSQWHESQSQLRTHVSAARCSELTEANSPQKTCRKQVKYFFLLISFFLLSMHSDFAATVTSMESGNFSSPATWSGGIVPVNLDNVVIATGDTINMDLASMNVGTLTIEANARLIIAAGNQLNFSSTFQQDGALDINGGDISCGWGVPWNLGNSGVLIWNPFTNTSAGGTLWIRSAKSLADGSTVIIKKWFDYTIPLATYVPGNIGNLTLNSPNGAGGIAEWNQQNMFETHPVLGTLTIDQGWITLDKSGTISNTVFNGIVLSGVNSTLYGHSGTHPGTFIIQAASFTNQGGIFYGLSDGNGNIEVDVTGNFINSGNVKIINNSGIANVSNGNAVFTVGGTYTQSAGDTRILYNVSTTNSGVFNATFGNLNLNGGIFMGQTACHTGGGTCNMTIMNDMNVNFTIATSKFRGTSLSSIGANFNNVLFNLKIIGNLNITGPSASEFTSAASSGNETMTVNGNVQVNGGTVSFNYGTTAASHPYTLTVRGNMDFYGGLTFLTRNGNYSVLNIGGNLKVHSGAVAIKGWNGEADVIVNGNFHQNGGYFYMHSNGTQATANPVRLTVYGNFDQSAGSFSFDDNATASSAAHELIYRGQNYTLSGTGVMTHAGAGTNNSFGLIRFIRNGTIKYSRPGNSHKLEQVKQLIEGGTSLLVQNGGLQAASHNQAYLDMIQVRPGAELDLGNQEIIKEVSYPYSGITIDSAAVFSIASDKVLLSSMRPGTATSNIGKFDFALDSNSILEYSGSGSQVLGASDTSMTSNRGHLFGFLRVNMKHDTGDQISLNSDIVVRNGLQLVKGSLRLNGHSLTILNGDPNAITRSSGWIVSEDDNGFITWKNMGMKTYEFPFGDNQGNYLPVTFTPEEFPTGRVKNEFSISTRGTNDDNQPFPLPEMSMTTNNIDLSKPEVIDRFWTFNNAGIKGHVTVTYAGSENTLRADLATGNLSILNWEGSRWSDQFGSGTGELSGTGTVSAVSTNALSTWVVVSNMFTLPIELIAFDALAADNEVRVNWTTASEINVSTFTVERSTDGIHFDPIETVNGAGNSTVIRNYGIIDRNPVKGLSYYRLRTTNYNGSNRYSELRVVNFSGQLPSLRIDKASPNPFDEQFKVLYTLQESGSIEFILSNSSGKLIHKKKEQGSVGTNTFHFIDETGLSSGTYILNVIYKDKSYPQKVVKK